MFELLTTEAFATWFSALEAGPAEDVAATLEVIVQLGARREAPGSSDALLWYQHPILAERHLPDIPAHLPPEVVRFTQDWGRFNGYVRRVIKHLESRAFVARLPHLSAGDAGVVSGSLERIRRLLKTRMLAVSDYQTRKRLFTGRKPAEGEVTAWAAFVDESEVRAAYFAALAAAGFEVTDAPANPASLREISLRSAPPGLRLLYGIDEARDRGLVVVGEWLDRSFYGDSVRRAEAIWGAFLRGLPLATQPAAPR